jgi:hypothetical protein
MHDRYNDKAFGLLRQQQEGRRRERKSRAKER